MKRICLGISESKMSRCWASEKVPWQWGSLREALKVTRTLTTGRPGERAPAPLVGLDSDQSDNEQGGGVWHTLPLVPSTHRDSSRTPPNPGEVGGGGAGTVPAGQLGKTGPGGKSEDECLINRGLSSSQK